EPSSFNPKFAIGKFQPILRSIVIVVYTHDIVFAEIFPTLHFNDDQRPFVGILQTMNRAYWKIYCIVGLEKKHIFIANCASLSFNYYPMLIALEVVLQTEALSGIYHKPFDFVVLSFLNDGKVSPRSDLGHFNFFCQRLTQRL